MCECQPMCLSMGRPDTAARRDSQQGPVHHMVKDSDFFFLTLASSLVFTAGGISKMLTELDFTFLLFCLYFF